MFHGHSVCTLDAKSRLMLPTKFRKNIKPEADNKLVLTRGFDDCILMYPFDEWVKVESKLKGYNEYNPEERFYVRQFMVMVNEVELDSQNRILIPAQLIEFAKLKKEIIVVGMLDKMEIWDPEIKKNYDNSMSKSYEEIAEKAMDLRNSQKS